MTVVCPVNYKCLLEPQWSPEQWLPVVAVVMVTLIVLLAIAAWARRRG